MDFGKHIFDTDGAPPSRKHQAFSVSIEHLVISLSFGEFPAPCASLMRKNEDEEEQPKRARFEAPCASRKRKNEDQEEDAHRPTARRITDVVFVKISGGFTLQ